MLQTIKPLKIRILKIKILFVLNGYWEWIGIRCLSAALKDAGFECDLIIEEDINKIACFAKEYSPDFVAYHTVAGQHNFCLTSANAIKKVFPKAKIIFGGPHATLYPDIIKEEQVDFVCQGEGDISFVELVRKVSNGESALSIPSIWAKDGKEIIKNPPQNLIENLDLLPLPDNEIFEKYDVFRKSKSRNIMAGRGCPYNCSFCFNKSFKNLYSNKRKYVRFRSPERIIEEIQILQGKYSFEYIRFQDDTLTIDKEWFLDFSKKYKQKVSLPYFSSLRANCLDEEIVCALKESGCVLAGFGVESGVENIRNKLLKKNIKDETIYNAADLLHKYGIPFATSNMLALPNETLEDALKTIKMNVKMKTKYPWYSVFQPFPGTDIACETEKMYNITISHEKICADYHSDSILGTVTSRQLSKLHKFAVIATKFPSLIPIILILIKLPNNIFFKVVHRISHFWLYAGINKIGFFNTFLIGLKHELSQMSFRRDKNI